MKKLFFIALPLLATVGCSHNAPVDMAPSYDVYSNYADKMPGKYALYVDAGEMKTTAKTKGVACAGHKYPIDGVKQFEMSVLKTFENLVEVVEITSAPLDQTDLEAHNYAAQLVVEVRDVDVDLVVIPGFWTNQVEADVEISASVSAVSQLNGRVLGSTIEGDGDATNDVGMLCDGGGKAVGSAMGVAMKETMQRLGERLANARRMREESELARR